MGRIRIIPVRKHIGATRIEHANKTRQRAVHTQQNKQNTRKTHAPRVRARCACHFDTRARKKPFFASSPRIFACVARVCACPARVRRASRTRQERAGQCGVSMLRSESVTLRILFCAEGRKSRKFRMAEKPEKPWGRVTLKRLRRLGRFKYQSRIIRGAGSPNFSLTLSPANGEPYEYPRPHPSCANYSRAEGSARKPHPHNNPARNATVE